MEKIFDSSGRLIKPQTIKKQKSKPKQMLSYKLRADKNSFGPLENIKLLHYDKTSKGKLTLNSFIQWGQYKGSLISDIYIKDKKYLISLAINKPKIFSIELLNILK